MMQWAKTLWFRFVMWQRQAVRWAYWDGEKICVVQWSPPKAVAEEVAKDALAASRTTCGSQVFRYDAPPHALSVAHAAKLYEARKARQKVTVVYSAIGDDE